MKKKWKTKMGTTTKNEDEDTNKMSEEEYDKKMHEIRTEN